MSKSPGGASQALLASALLAAAFSVHNPVDALVRGKWVRFFDTLMGDHTATLCLPAQTPGEVAQHRSGLPERVAALHAAGAAVVLLDMDLSAPDPSDAALAEAARLGPTVMPSGDSAPAFAWDGPTGARDQVTTPGVDLVLGIAGRDDALALRALEYLPGGPEARAALRTDQGFYPFMPVLLPFLHWDDRSSWDVAPGRAVFVGACKADRDWTRFGRQPAPVAHSELVETALAGRHPTQASPLLDVGLAALTFGLGLLGRRRFGAVGVLPVAAGALALSLGISLAGVWTGLTPILIAALAALAARTPR